MYRKVASSSLSRLVAHFQIFRRLVKGKCYAYAAVTFNQKVSKLNSRTVYCLQLGDYKPSLLSLLNRNKFKIFKLQILHFWFKKILCLKFEFENLQVWLLWQWKYEKINKFLKEIVWLDMNHFLKRQAHPSAVKQTLSLVPFHVLNLKWKL